MQLIKSSKANLPVSYAVGVILTRFTAAWGVYVKRPVKTFLLTPVRLIPSCRSASNAGCPSRKLQLRQEKNRGDSLTGKLWSPGV